MKKYFDVLKNGIIKNNPTFRLVLGTCPTLAVTTSAINGFSMGIATSFVLIFSNILISLLRKTIPDKVRIPAFIMVIATFTTIVEMVMRKFVPALYNALGLFIPLIVVNCILLARAESFASVNPVTDSALDGLGMGIGFTLSLTLLGTVRELIGAGSVFGYEIGFLQIYKMSVFVLPAGAFFVYGLSMAAFNAVVKKLEEKGKKATEEVSA
ncbi:MAG: electron transport complex subunit RsxE [Christensenellales bacterium]